MPRRSGARRRLGASVLRMAVLMPVMCAALASRAFADTGILFARTTAVPPPIRAFAWHVIETRCNYQSFERQQRWFWAYDTKASQTAAGVVYSISVLSERSWKKTDPPAMIEMTIVDDGDMRLTALRSSFITCVAEREQ